MLLAPPSLQDVSNLQADLNALFYWATKWQMRFNVNECKVMHLRAKNMHASYILGGVQLGGICSGEGSGGLGRS